MRHTWPTLLLVTALTLPLAGRAAAQSLDELLDLPGTAPTPTDTMPPGDQPQADQPAVDIDSELDRTLSDPDTIPILLQQALHDMEDASKQLRADAGLSTQRTMEQAMLKLDRLIAEAQKQQQQSSSSSSSSSSSQSQSGEQESSQQQGGSQQNAGQENQSQAGGQQGDQQDDPQNMANNGEAGINPNNRTNESGSPVRPLKELGEEWGKLPARVRQDLQEGLDERFSPLYRDMTEDYYRRLAEEGK